MSKFVSARLSATSLYLRELTPLSTDSKLPSFDFNLVLSELLVSDDELVVVPDPAAPPSNPELEICLIRWISLSRFRLTSICKTYF